MTTPSNPSTDAEPSAPTSKPRRLPEWISRVPKPAWIALGAGFAVLALVLALVPIVGSAIARNNAVEDLTLPMALSGPPMTTSRPPSRNCSMPERRRAPRTRRRRCS